MAAITIRSDYTHLNSLLPVSVDTYSSPIIEKEDLIDWNHKATSTSLPKEAGVQNHS